jgi:hypothetical protein
LTSNLGLNFRKTEKASKQKKRIVRQFFSPKEQQSKIPIVLSPSPQISFFNFKKCFFFDGFESPSVRALSFERVVSRPPRDRKFQVRIPL